MSNEKSTYSLPPELQVTSDGPVRILTINRPEDLNGVNRALHQALAGVWAQIGDDADARAVIITGAGDAFSAGGDFAYMQENLDDPELRAKTIEEARAIVGGIVRCKLPVIAAVNGPAVGLGCSLAVLSDLVLLSDQSFLADPHLRMGLVPGDGGLVWPLLTSLSRAREHLFLGQRIMPADAVQWGLASRVVPSGDLAREALSLAHRLAAVPQAAFQSTKSALNSYVEMHLDNAFDIAFTGELESMSSPEHRNAVDAARNQSRAQS
ncbi:enoyl-CoA hydratase/isomerase family protein [Gordonia insulae]|uniref:Short-chain-enoyl-CoA hydratase n=1 Tax=Gordonia insulae TaxID=2420509 RepID=A0A3G8JLM0_9ACTN|nr:enoyl-CoA hydratase/isomerase family protein [Gordonia insulae]AZG45472.1 Short-chain-enoyl-CoA hydratase [Gordonia insulae]